MQKQKQQQAQAIKMRKDKKKNTQTGLLMGQNTNIFSQLSATYLQTKSSATQQQTNFANSTQIIQYHDPNINRLIALLRKKADVTKAKAAMELKQEMLKMNQDNIQEFIQTFSHLFMEIIINQQSKQVIDQFISMMNNVLTNFKKIAIKEIATIFGPLFVINRSNNLNQIKIYSMLFNGTQEQLHEKAITLLLSKNVMKKFLVFCRVIIECQETHKIGQQNFQRNCSSLLKLIKDFIKSYELIPDKKQQLKEGFAKFISQINEIVSGKFVQQYFKIGGKAKSSFLQFYQALITASTKHLDWDIDWEVYAKILCQNYLDKDLMVQQALWRYVNKQFIESSLQWERLQREQQEQNKQQIKQKAPKKKQKYDIFHNYLPKADQKLITALKLGGQTLYKQLPAYCTVFPYTSFQQKQSHKSMINKITFIRKIMQTILQLQDQNQARVQCYYQLSLYFVNLLRNITGPISELDEKKQQQIKTLAMKAQKQIVNSLQDRYYKNPPTSRNAFTYNVPVYFCKILEQCQPNFDFIFDQKQTFSLYTNLKNNKNSEYITILYSKIYDNCKNDQNLLLQYLQSFPSKTVPLDMTEANPKLQQSSKIFLLSQQSKNPQNWFNQNWDLRKKLIVFDPRITAQDLAKVQQYESSHQYNFKPTNKSISDQRYVKAENDQQRFNYFIKCLQDNQLINMIPYMLPMIKEVLMDRNNQNKVRYVNKLLQIHNKGVQKLVNKQWIVSQLEVLRVRALADLILQGLKGLDQAQKIQQGVNEQLLNSFLKNYCVFALTIYNYKLESQAQQLLKLVSKTIYIQKISQRIFNSAQQSIRQAYQSFAKSGSTQNKQIKQGQQRQRKNRLNRLLNYIKKVVWYAVNKKKQQYYISLFEELLSNPDWKHAEHRPDLWLIAESYLQIMDDKIKRGVIQMYLKKHDKYSHFVDLLMCCQLILPLQRHPSTKKIILQLQGQTVKQIIQSNNSQQSLNILSSMINQSISGDSFLLVYGVKNLLKNLMKNYHKLPKQVLQKYVVQCVQKPLSSLKQSSDSTQYQRKCILLINLVSQLPLLDLPKIQQIYSQILKLSQTQTNPIKILGYYTLIATIWQSSIGTDRLTSQLSSQMIQRILASLVQVLNQKNIQNNNFARYAALTFFNIYIQIRSKQELKQYEEYILKQIVWTPVQQGSLLHGNLQSSRFKYISKIFSTSSKQLQQQIVKQIPQQIIKQVNFYKQVLDQIEDQDQQTDKDMGGEDKGMNKNMNKQQHYQIIIHMFIELAEVLVRITAGLTPSIKPKQQTILELLQCPFAGIKKTAFMLLKQMYQFNLVERVPPVVFLTYLKINTQYTKCQLNPIIANILSSYLYSWQAIIQRRSAIQRPASDQQNTMTLQDYLQNQQLHQLFLKSIFEILENQLQFTKNQQDYQISAQELIEMDAVINIQDDYNMLNKIFRLTIRTLFKFIQNFPLFLRNFMDKNKKYKNTCDRLLRNVISDAIFKQEITKIQMTEPQWKAAGNFEIYVTPKNKQIYAQYTHDVIRIGLRLTMKGNYPLTPISIQFGEGLKIDEGSRWALMLQNQLHSRNNTIINGILLWKDNIDKKLAGVEQCAICFDIVNSSGQLPKKGCKTCKKKFHSVCVMKWFSKSNKSQCPLCKSQFL